MSKLAGYYDVREALAQPGCPQCWLLARDADNYIDGVLLEMVNDPLARRSLNQARGYCREHAWLLVRHGASLGAAILMLDVLETVLGVLETAEFEVQPDISLQQARQQAFNQQPDSQVTAKLVADLAPQELCPVCVHLQTSQGYYLEALLTHLSGLDSLASLYCNSDGLCLPHFRLALSRVADEQTFMALLEVQQTVWQRLRADLREFIRKNDYHFSEEGFGEEGDSWLWAIEAISGAKKVANCY